jgi:hypothetical protein
MSLMAGGPLDGDDGERDIPITQADLSLLEDVLASIYNSEDRAGTFLGAIRFPRELIPAWRPGSTALEYWWLIFEELDRGVMLAPYRRLLSTALRNHPAEPRLADLRRKYLDEHKYLDEQQPAARPVGAEGGTEEARVRVGFERRTEPPGPAPRSAQAKATGGVFISYRRADAGAYARLLQLQLRDRLPGAKVFMDLDSIEPGLDFADVIRDALDSSVILLALIGRQWATITGDDGSRRLDDPDDFVRLEVKTALERGVRVIPVLVDGARALRQEQLPDELRKLARLSPFELSHGHHYEYDAGRLVELIGRVLEAAR